MLGPSTYIKPACDVTDQPFGTRIENGIDLSGIVCCSPRSRSSAVGAAGFVAGAGSGCAAAGVGALGGDWSHPANAPNIAMPDSVIIVATVERRLGLFILADRI